MKDTVGGACCQAKSADSAASLLLEREAEERNSEVELDHSFVVTRSRCFSRFCPDCCERLGIALRDRLRPIVETFESVMMFTLTLDPELFDGPEQAFRYVREKRCLSIVMQDLRRGGYLKSSRYFYVVEWQANGWPHWHVLVDAEFVPFEALYSAWGKFRPACAGPIAHASVCCCAACGGSGEQPRLRPAFGAVRFSAPRFGNAAHAANYATKYLTKFPKDGYPQWVLDFEGQIKKFGTSRGFWGEPPQKKAVPPPAADVERDHAKDCHCDECSAVYLLDWDGEPFRVPEPERRRQTVGERIGACGMEGNVFRVSEVYDEEGPQQGEVRQKWEYFCRLRESFDDLCFAVLRVVSDECRAIPISPAEAWAIREGHYQGERRKEPCLSS